MKIKPGEIPTPKLHGLLLGTIGPRPIALASTVDKEGNVNLSPFSFFNVFSANPPVLIFSPARRVRDNTTKHTLENALATKEVVINIVTYPIVEQMSLSSTEYDQGVNEFIKSGLSEVQSDVVAPPRVGESIASYECKVNEVIHLGDSGGAGNLIVCEVVLAHFNDNILNEDGVPDQSKVDLVGRMGGDWYCRANGDAIFEIPKPNRNKGIGVDQIPERIRNSQVLTGNNLGRLGNVTQIPDQEAVKAFGETNPILRLRADFQADSKAFEAQLHQLAQTYLQENDVEKAWLTLLQGVH